MPRRRYYRRYTRVVAPKKKWATNMTSGTMTKSIPVNTIDHVENVLVSNSAQTSTPTPVIVKTGNFKVQGDCYLTVQNTTQIISTVFRIVVYVMYLPEVVVAQASALAAISDHPEWIMAWKVVDVNVGGANSNSNAFSFSSRLKRNLNSGDTIALVAVATNGSNVGVNMTMNYVAQYWTCAN